MLDSRVVGGGGGDGLDGGPGGQSSGVVLIGVAEARIERSTVNASAGGRGADGVPEGQPALSTERAESGSDGNERERGDGGGSGALVGGSGGAAGNSNLNLNGGVVTIGGNIVRLSGSGAGVVNVNGADVDFTGKAIGTGHHVFFNAQAGTIRNLGLEWPTIDDATRRRIEEARRLLEAE